MLLLRIWNYVRGYVIILIKGFFYEKFINICTHRQIFLWDIKRLRDGNLTLKVSIKGFKLLRPIARKTGCRVRILRKRGIPFLINRYRRRKTFFLGTIVFLALMYILTSFIWVVEVEGNKDIETGLIIEKLAELGVKPGVIKYGIDTDKAVSEIMLHINQLAWASITVKGTKVKVQVAERKMPPPLVPKDEPSNIIARRDGVIKTITVKEGLRVVKAGDTVTKGQILVSGSIPQKGDESKVRLVHSIASVVARTWYEGVHPVQTVISEKRNTGKIKENFSVMIFNKRIDLFHRDAGFEVYEKEEIRKSLSIGKDMVLPLGILIDRYIEKEVVDREIDLEEAKSMAAEKAYEEAVKDIPENAEIIKSNVSFKETADGGIMAVATVECLEEIGIEQRIGGN